MDLYGASIFTLVFLERHYFFLKFLDFLLECLVFFHKVFSVDRFINTLALGCLKKDAVK